MTSECAVCYVSDAGFLLPTLISVMSLRKFVPADKADVYIFTIDDNEARIRDIAKFMEAYSVRVVPMSGNALGGFDEAKWNANHVPKSSLGRFLITDALPSGYKRILYLDGDTLVIRDPTPLIDYPIAEGRFGAVEDIDFFCPRDWTANGETARKHFKAIGVDPAKGYFNAGVFLVTPNTWTQIAQEAFAFFKDNVDKCRYHDQSAMNAVIGDRRLRLSLAWNFQTPYRYWGIEKEVQPRIYHFTQSSKPWMGPAGPWKELFPFYEKEIHKLSALNLPRKVFTGSEIQESNAENIMQKNKLRYLMPLRLFSRRKTARQLNAGAVQI